MSVSNKRRLSSAELLPLVYEELRRLATARMAAERPGHELQSTALVHEVYLRLASREGSDLWESKAHFFGAAAEAMRRILINYARDRNTLKGGRGWQRVSLENLTVGGNIDEQQLVQLSDLIDMLANEDKDSGEIAKLRILAGMTIAEIAVVTGHPKRTVDRLWLFVRAWLQIHLSDDATC